MNLDDIKIKTDKKCFKFRVAGIVESEGKILTTKMRNNNFYCFPGGHVEFLEDTLSAVKRELKEELFFSFKVKKLLYIHENMFKKDDKNFHELCFYFKVVPTEKVKKEDLIWEEIDNGEKLFHNYKWIDLKEINNYDIRPKRVVEKYLINKNKFSHFSTKNN